MQLWAVGVRGRAGTPPVRPLRRSACRAAVYRLARHELAPPLCVCVCATQPGAGCGVCSL